MKIILLTLLLLSFAGPWSGLAQSQEPTPLPTPPSPEITPDVFPSLLPLPPKPPVDEPSPEPTATPLPRPSASVAVPAGQVKLDFAFPQVTEGQRLQVRLQLKGQTQGLRYPIKGQISYSDSNYSFSQQSEEKIPFEMNGPEAHSVSLLFRSAGRKKVQISTDMPGLPSRNALVYVEPFKATVFPKPIDVSGFQPDPKLWHVWVNLHHSLAPQQTQHQYYMVTYRGEIVQKLLTSSATPDKITPQGQFKLGVKASSPRSTLYDSVMPFWTTIQVPGFSFEYGNHGLVGEAYLYSLGLPASHGCLRLSNKWVQQNGNWLNIGGAKWVYTHVPVGTPIHIFKKPVQPFASENYRMWLARR